LRMLMNPEGCSMPFRPAINQERRTVNSAIALGLVTGSWVTHVNSLW
jgi:hypothetical protein